MYKACLLYTSSKSKLNLKSVYIGADSAYPNNAYHPKVVDMGKNWNGYHYWLSYTPYPHGNDKYENPTIVGSNDIINYSEISAVSVDSTAFSSASSTSDFGSSSFTPAPGRWPSPTRWP